MRRACSRGSTPTPAVTAAAGPRREATATTSRMPTSSRPGVMTQSRSTSAAERRCSSTRRPPTASSVTRCWRTAATDPSFSISAIRSRRAPARGPRTTRALRSRSTTPTASARAPATRGGRTRTWASSATSSSATSCATWTITPVTPRPLVGVIGTTLTTWGQNSA